MLSLPNTLSSLRSVVGGVVGGLVEVVRDEIFPPASRTILSSLQHINRNADFCKHYNIDPSSLPPPSPSFPLPHNSMSCYVIVSEPVSEREQQSSPHENVDSPHSLFSVPQNGDYANGPPSPSPFPTPEEEEELRANILASYLHFSDREGEFHSDPPTAPPLSPSLMLSLLLSYTPK